MAEAVTVAAVEQWALGKHGQCPRRVRPRTPHFAALRIHVSSLSRVAHSRGEMCASFGWSHLALCTLCLETPWLEPGVGHLGRSQMSLAAVLEHCRLCVGWGHTPRVCNIGRSHIADEIGWSHLALAPVGAVATVSRNMFRTLKRCQQSVDLSCF